MRLLSNEEVEELYRESDIAKLSWFSWQKVIAKAQRELTNKEWVEWLEGNAIWSEVPHLTGSGVMRNRTMRCIYPNDLEARLKEVNNE